MNVLCHLGLWAGIVVSGAGAGYGQDGPCALDAGTCNGGSIFATDVPDPGQLSAVRLEAIRGSAPFAAQDWPAHGLATELIAGALGEAEDITQLALTWSSEGLDHGGAGSAPDIKFPVLRRACGPEGTGVLCDDVLVSDPIVEVLDLVFVWETTTGGLETLLGRPGAKVCSPRDAATVVVPDARATRVEGSFGVAACFEQLRSGAVEGVVMDEFSGWLAVHALGLASKVRPLPQPLGPLGVHAVVSKTHWRATTLHYRLNAGLAALRASGAHAKIVARHLKNYRTRLGPAG